MMFTDKAFAIWMGHAGEDAQVFAQDDTSIDVRALERTQVLAIARRDTTGIAKDVAPATRRSIAEREPERLAA
jgi:hypothetical protein